MSKLALPVETDLMEGREVMIFISLCLSLIALMSILQENTGAFDDLGKLLVGGLATAIVVAIAFTLVRFRLRDKKPPTSNFISISTEKD